MKLLEKVYSKRYLVVTIALSVGVLLRLYVSTLGHNFDLESYEIVAKIMQDGGNVYAQTARYNYGPIWFNILHILYQLTAGFQNHFQAFGLAITILLTLVDVGIFTVLWKQYRLLAAILFFLNPVSIIISGYHRQFDNLAVLLALLACIITLSKVKSDKQPLLQLLAQSALLGLSLTTKHIFFVFPLWLAVKQKGIAKKLLALIVPVAIFLVSFLPYWAGKDGIIQNVFLYRSFSNAPLLNSVMPALLAQYFPPFLFFIASLTLGAFIARKRNLLDSALIYTGFLVVFASAIANQYLAIVMPFLAVFPNALFGIYTAQAFIWLLISEAGLNIQAIAKVIPDKLVAYKAAITMLFLGLVWYLYRQKVRTFGMKVWIWVKEEVVFQISSLK